MTKASDEDVGCLLAIVMDLHPQVAKEEGRARQYLDSILSFVNLHLADSANNQVIVLAANHSGSKFLYPINNTTKEFTQSDGRLEGLSHIDNLIVEELKKMMAMPTSFCQTESLLAGAIGRALLYIRQKENNERLGNKMQARVLVIKCSTDTGGQYLNYINMYLTAQKMGTVIDMCVVGENDCGLIQQGADITGGYYIRIKDISSLLQTLLLHFSSTVTLRKKLNYPIAAPVDYRAACFCHKSLVDMAHVCSNCLSVYCKSVPLCSTCHVFFRVEMPVRKPVKRKR